MKDPVIAERASRSAKISAKLPPRKTPSSGGTPSSELRPVRIDIPPQPAQLPPGLVTQQIADVRRHLERCVENLKGLEAANTLPASGGSAETMTGVSPVTIRTVAACLSELLKLEWTQPHREYCPDLCKLLDCPQRPVLRHAVCHTIEVLEKTKWRFKSKELKALREGLQAFLVNSGHSHFTPESVT
jgi:hypothetical protein